MNQTQKGAAEINHWGFTAFMNQWAFIAYVRYFWIFFLPLDLHFRIAQRRRRSQFIGSGSIQADTIGLAAMQEGLEVLGIIPWQWAGALTGERTR